MRATFCICGLLCLLASPAVQSKALEGVDEQAESYLHRLHSGARQISVSQALGAPERLAASGLCDTATLVLSRLSGLDDVRAATLVAASQGCLSIEGAQAALQAAGAAFLEQGEQPSLGTSLAALQVAAAVKASLGDTLQEAAAAQQLIDDINAHMASSTDGLWNSASSLFTGPDAAPSVAATGHALQLLPVMKALGLQCTGCERATGANIAATFTNYSSSKSGKVSASGDTSAIVATAEFVIGVVSSGNAAQAGRPALSQVAHFLRKYPARGDPTASAAVSAALQALALLPADLAPVVIAIKTTSLPIGGGPVLVSVTNAVDEAAPDARMHLTVGASGERTLRPEGRSGILFSVDLAEKDGLTAGQSVSVAVQRDGMAPVTATLPITQHYSFKQFQWTPSTSAKQTVKEQATLSSGDVLAMDALEVKVTVASSRGLGPDFPAQASIVFTPPTGQSVSFALALKGEGVLSAYIPADKLRALSGEVEVLVSVGDSTLATPLQWRLGTQNFAGPVAPLSQQDLLYAKPADILHTFRAEHKQPAAGIPILAALVTMVPLAFWLAALSSQKFSIQAGLRSAGVSGQIFLGAIGATLGLAIYFWMRLSVIQLLWPLAGMVLVLVVFGHLGLSNLADARLASQGKAE